MDFLCRIFAFFMAALSFVFPWLNREEQKNPDTYIVEDKCLTVCLSSNPSTGYTWVYEICGEGIKLDSEKFYSSTGNELISGASGVDEFKFVTSGEGSFEIVFCYLRTWEDKLPERTVILKGCVDKDGNITVEEFEM